MKDLFEIIKDISYDLKEKFIDILLEDPILPRNTKFFTEKREGKHYTQDRLVSEFILSYFTRKGVFVKQKIINYILKEPLKRVGYGVANAEDLPEDILKSLGKFYGGMINIYLLVGVWNTKAGEDKLFRGELERQTILELICNITEKGIKSMKYIHGHIDEVTDGRKKDYMTDIRLTYDNKILEEIEEARKKSKQEYNKFTNKIYLDIRELNNLYQIYENQPLFFDKEKYNKIKNKVLKVIEKTSYGDEFIKRYAGGYPGLNIMELLKNG